MKSKKKQKEDFGQRFLIEFADASLDFYWAIDVKIILPKNRVLTGITQELQKVVSYKLFVGVFKDGRLTMNFHQRNFKDICERSMNEIVITDSNGNSYTGEQFLSILNLCEVDS